MTYWTYLDTLVAESTIEIDRPKGSRHPRNQAVVYPLDYGYLDETKADDGDGIDIWVGSKPDPKQVEGIITTVDLAKRDAEIKILFGTTDEEISLALETHNAGTQAAKLIRREAD
jgi:inorganic pyrophosphatase